MTSDFSDSNEKNNSIFDEMVKNSQMTASINNAQQISRRSCRMDNLVDDVLVIILEHLSILDRMRLERVCRRWQRLSLNSWQNVRSLRFNDIYDMDDEFVDVRDCNRVLISLLKRSGSHLITLDMSDSFSTGAVMDFSERAYRAVGKYCPNLSELDLSYVALNNIHLQTLAEYSSQITKLSFVRCFEDEPQADVGLALIFQCLKSLYYLDLSMNETVTGECFCAMRPSLRCVRLNSCFLISARSMELMSQRCPDLSRLELYGCVHSLNIVLENLPYLEILNLNSCQGNDLLYQVIRERLNAIRDIDLGHSSSMVTDQMIIALAEGCPQLERLNVSGKFGRVTSGGLQMLARCKQLKELDVSWLEAANDDVIALIAKHCTLQSLHAHLCDRLTKTGISNAVRSSATLTYVDVTGCTQIDMQCLRAVSEICSEKRQRLTVHLSGEQGSIKQIQALNHQYFRAEIIL